MLSAETTNSRSRTAPHRVLVVYRFQRNTADGGSAYERMLLDGLSRSSSVDAHAIVLGTSKLHMYARMVLEPAKFRRMLSNSPEYHVIVETMDAAFLPLARSQRRISIIHHLGFSRNRIYSLFERPLIARLKRAGCVVTVSKYWMARLLENGFRNVRLIYNGFHLSDFDFDDEELERFRQRYDLVGKPIIYLGSYGRYKGTQQAAECLSGLDVHLVVSGDATYPIPGTRTLRLYRRDYVRLLRTSSLAITMSQFDEGWCRTAHEAMLCGTPVIGSGRGGMRELLQGGGQVICGNFADLSGYVRAVLSDAEWSRSLAEAGQNFARHFSAERLRQGWDDLVTHMNRDQEPQT